MKKLLPYFLLLFLFFTVNAGFDIAPQETFRPVFMLRSEMERSITLGSPQSIKNPGKIYLKDHLIFINEKFRGIHVIDNSDPENPQKRAFIQVDGCIAVSYTHLDVYKRQAYPSEEKATTILFPAGIRSRNFPSRFELVPSG